MSGRITVACAHCGKAKRITPSQWTQRHFCDRRCYAAWRDHGLTAIGKRRADDPYYAARDADLAVYNPEAEDRAILAERRLLECR